MSCHVSALLGKKCRQLFSSFISLFCSLLSSSFVISGVKKERLRQMRMSWRGRQSKWLDLMKWACSQWLFKWGLLGFWGQVLHTLPSARSTHDVYTSSKSWIQPLLSKVPWLQPAALEITAICSEGFTPLVSAKLSTKTEECSTPDLSVLPLLALGLLPPVSGLFYPPLVEGYLSAGHNASVSLGAGIL